MSKYLRLQESDCKNCYKCIRHCPVKSISFSSGRAHIVGEECVLCGQCYTNCPQNAKNIRNDLPAAKSLLQSGVEVFASVAPAFAANFPGVGFKTLQNALTALGFKGAEETAAGATIVKNRYDAMINSGEHSVVISSSCHTVNLLISRYYPGALSYLAKVQSPMQAHSAAIKRENPGSKTVFIGPCISKKAEAEQYAGLVDCVLTFEELALWLEQENISLPPEPDPAPGGKARLFPVVGGILRSMKADNPDYRYIVVDGMESCMAALADISAGNLERCFIEMSACRGSCIGGPAMSRSGFPVSGYAAVDRLAGAEDFPVKMPGIEDLYKDIPFEAVRKVRPGGAAIAGELRKMGKTKPSDELNCGSCGYSTCRDKAAAILAGKADTSMCLPYLMTKAQSFSDTILYNTPNGIIVLNESLEVQQINAAACSIMNMKNQYDIVGRQVASILDPTPFISVLNDRRNLYEHKLFLAEYRRHIITSILFDREFNIVICIMRDITETEEARIQKEESDRKAIEITDKVIEKQMRTVQEIASLLGETTAETKIALTRLKETLQHE